MSPLRLLPLVLVLPSCGTILNGAPYMVDVQSSPAGASVFYKDRFMGKTPCTVAMDAWSMELRLSAQGCAETTHEVPSHPNWIGAIGNGLLLLPGIIIGNIVDLSTGSFSVPDDTSVHVTLSRGRIPQFAPQAAKPEPGTQRLSDRESQFAAYASRVGTASISDTSRYQAQGSIRIMRARVAPLTEGRQALESALSAAGSQAWIEQANRLLTWMKSVEAAAQRLLDKIEAGDLEAACEEAKEVDRLTSERPYAGQ